MSEFREVALWKEKSSGTQKTNYKWSGTVPQTQSVPCGSQKAGVLLQKSLHLEFKSRNMNILEVKRHSINKTRRRAIVKCLSQKKDFIKCVRKHS